MKHLSENRNEEMLQRYLDGELDARAMHSVTTHLAACRMCQEAVREAEQEINLLTAALAPEACQMVVPSAHLRERLANRIQQRKISSAAAPAKSLTTLAAHLFAPLQLIRNRMEALTSADYRLTATAAVAAAGLALLIAVVGTTEFVNRVSDNAETTYIAQVPQSVAAPNVDDQHPTREVRKRDLHSLTNKENSLPASTTAHAAVARGVMLNKVQPQMRVHQRAALKKFTNDKTETSKRGSLQIASTLSKPPSSAPEQQTQAAGEAAKEQVMLALHIASTELRAAQQQLQAGSGFIPTPPTTNLNSIDVKQ